jgi:Flp pilus assembly protein CpaB
VKRRRRAIAFVLAAAIAAATAAGLADSYRAGAVGGYGALRPVAVAGVALKAGRALAPADAARELELRRVPSRFVPVGALHDPSEAIGLAPLAPVPVGSYLLASQLRPPRRGAEAPAGLRGGRRPVQIAVSGGEALEGVGGEAGSKVDVVVTAEPTGPGPGRVYVAAAGVPLLSLGPDDPEGDGTLPATLGLTRRQALRLIAAESFARQVTLLPGS